MRKRFKKIYIEITNICNLSCDFCPKTERAQEFMSLELFEKALDESKPLTEEITLHLMGEPLLHPKIKNIIELTEEKEIRINLTTNGTLIQKHSQTLLNKTIRRINFSIHGLKSNYSTQEQEEHLSNIIAFTKIAQEEREDLIIIYRLWNINESSNEKIIKTIEEEFDVKIDSEIKKKSVKIKNNSFIHYDESFDWPNPKDEIRTEHGYCHGLSTHIGILSNGTVVPCCLDNNGNIPLGNIKETGLEDILAQRRAQDMIRGFRERKLVEDMCKKCKYIKRLEKNKDRT